MKIVKYKQNNLKSLLKKEFIQKLDELNLSDKYFNNLIKNRTHDEIIKKIEDLNREIDFCSLIMYSFSWRNSNEGSNFWSCIYRNYNN